MESLSLTKEQRIISTYLFASDACALRSILSVISSFAEECNTEIFLTPKDIVKALQFRRANFGHWKLSLHDEETDHEKVIRLFRQFAGNRFLRTQRIRDFPFLEEVDADTFYSYSDNQVADLSKLKRILSLNTQVCVTINGSEEIGDHIMHIRMNDAGNIIIVSDSGKSDPLFFEDYVKRGKPFDLIVFSKGRRMQIEKIIREKAMAEA